jgi:rhodanese-related sulfurtransferase
MPNFKTDISAKAFKKLMESKKNPQILDIRTEAEFEDFNFGGDRYDLEEILMDQTKINEIKNKEGIIICYTGLQSEIARKILAKKGFTKLKNLVGGIEEYLSL